MERGFSFEGHVGSLELAARQGHETSAIIVLKFMTPANRNRQLELLLSLDLERESKVR